MQSSRFPQTQWTLVDQAARTRDGPGRPALNELLLRYLPALRAHLTLRRRLPAAHVDDLLQSFISRRILEQRLIRKADRTRGRFRTFLLTSLENFVSNELRAARAQRRGGGKVRSLEIGDGIDPADCGALVPSDAFDVQWARQVLTEAVDHMHKQCEQSGRANLWALFEARVLRPAVGNEPAMKYEQLVQKFGFESPAQASNALVTAKRMFARMLRGVVCEYVDDESDADEEIGQLRQILARAGARAG